MSPKLLHHTYTLSPLQPTAHLASMEYPLNISLYILSTHHSSRFPLPVRQPTAAAVTYIFGDIIQLLSS